MLVSRFADSSKPHLLLTRPINLQPLSCRPRMSEDWALPPPVEPHWRGTTSCLPLSGQITSDRPPTSTVRDELPERASLGETSRRQAQDTFSTTGPALYEDWPFSNQSTTHSGSSASQTAYGDQSSQSRSIADDSVDEDEACLEGDDIDDDEAGRQQTVAERLAARRKMRRFRFVLAARYTNAGAYTADRLTHQQTRFLMSEFAKQPHPDAAHRERLSREIPGLSPRQVQVWFQNRYAATRLDTALRSVVIDTYTQESKDKEVDGR